MDTNTIELISLDENTGHARLHLSVDGDWSDYDRKIEGVLERLNIYIGFVASGQLAAREKYRGRRVKFLVHCEQQPPNLALVTFGRMKRHLEHQSIDFGVTSGPNLSQEIPLPAPA